MGPLSVLLLEDDDGDARLLEVLLREAELPVRIVRSVRLADVRDLAVSQRFDCALVDLNLPDSSGLDTFRAVRTLLPDVPLLVLSGLDDTKLAHQAVHEGAQDYLLKGALDGHGIARAIRYAIERQNTVHRLREVIAEQERLRSQLAGAVRMKEEFVAVAGHELRTPVTVIAGAAELLDQHLPHDLLTPECLRLFGALRRQSRRLTGLVGDLLLASRVERGVAPEEITRFEVAKLVEQAIEASGVEAQTITVDVPAALEIEGAWDRLIRVVVNLLTNAARHGAPPIEVVARDEGDRIGLEVRDHGSGVDAVFVPHLFEAFAQARPGGQGGTGLGLRIVKQLVEDAGGALAYRTAPDGGAIFRVAVPPSPPARRIEARRTKVMIVDDQVDARIVLRATLEASGRFEIVAECPDGVEAIEEARRLQPDLIVLDMEMPNLDGLAALEQLRVVAPQATTVILSGYPASRFEAASLAGGARAYLEKGLIGPELVDRLSMALTA